MSLAIDLTDSCDRMLKAERALSAEVRALRGVIPDVVYGRVQAALCEVTSEANRVKITLGAMRMAGDLDQRPAPVTAESLELAGFHVPTDATGAVEFIPTPSPPPALREHVMQKASQCGHTGTSFVLLRASLRRAGDDSLDDIEEGER